MREISECKSEPCRCRARLCLFSTKCFGFLINEQHLNSTQRVRAEERAFKSRQTFFLSTSLQRYTSVLLCGLLCLHKGWAEGFTCAKWDKKVHRGIFCVCVFANMEILPTGNLAIISCTCSQQKKAVRPVCRQKYRLIVSVRRKREKNFQRAFTPLCWEHSLSGVFRKKKRAKRQAESERRIELGLGSISSLVLCQTVPLLGSVLPTVRGKASRWAPSIDCQSGKIWGNTEWAVLHNNNLFLMEIFFLTYQLHIEVKMPRNWRPVGNSFLHLWTF